MKSKICTGHTTHTRISPIKRYFKYHLNYLLVDLDDASKLNKLHLFKWNSRLFFSINDQDYLLPGSEPLKTKLNSFMRQHSPETNYQSTFLLTCPKFFGLNFNPVNFFFLLDPEQNITSIIAEVHNTFKEKHLYLLTDPIEKKNGLYFEHSKNFHVSPFFNVEGKYCFLFSKKIDMIDISINYYKGNTHMFNAHLKLDTQPLRPYGFFKMTLNFLFTAASTFPRILFQATKLKFFHRLPHFKNMGLRSNQSFSRKSPSFLSKISMRMVNHYLKNISHGHLRIECPNGEVLSYGDSNASLSATIIVDDYRFFTYLLTRSDIGLSDSYIHHFWRTTRLDDIFNIFILNASQLKTTNIISSIWKFMASIQHRLKRNNISNAKKNIYEHYDLGNDFFKLFLDERRVYSSGIFSTPSISLEEAQITKFNHALGLADVNQHHRILEIGSGWGGLAIHAAQTIGCHVTTVTISQEQYNYVKQEINRLHLDAKIEVKLMDYRLLTGKYDRIISIEMLEAVGHDYLRTYFSKCHDLLHRDGKAVFQCIMIPDDRYDTYRKSVDFIQKYIFPGGHLPSPSALKSAVSSSNLEWVESHDITEHYVPTLKAWEKQFMSNEQAILNMGFDSSFIKTWTYYFNYCAAAFNSNYIYNHQFVIQKCS